MSTATEQDIKKTLEMLKNTSEGELTMNFLLNKVSLKKGFDLSEEDLENLYAAAYMQYNYGKYPEATILFKSLTQFDLGKAKFWIGLGAAQFMQKLYTESIMSYAYAFICDSTDANIPFYMAEAYLALGEKELASNSLSIAESLLKDKKLSKKETLLYNKVKSLNEMVTK